MKLELEEGGLYLMDDRSNTSGRIWGKIEHGKVVRWDIVTQGTKEPLSPMVLCGHAAIPNCLNITIGLSGKY